MTGLNINMNTVVKLRGNKDSKHNTRNTYNTYNVSGTILSALCILSHPILITTLQFKYIIIPIFQIRKLPTDRLSNLSMVTQLMG